MTVDETLAEIQKKNQALEIRQAKWDREAKLRAAAFVGHPLSPLSPLSPHHAGFCLRNSTLTIQLITRWRVAFRVAHLPRRAVTTTGAICQTEAALIKRPRPCALPSFAFKLGTSPNDIEPLIMLVD
jgi:hypothetical protein